MSEILAEAINEAIVKHGSLRAAARAMKYSASHLCRLRNGIQVNPGDALLKRLGLRRVVTITYLPVSKS